MALKIIQIGSPDCRGQYYKVVNEKGEFYFTCDRLIRGDLAAKDRAETYIMGYNRALEDMKEGKKS